MWRMHGPPTAGPMILMTIALIVALALNVAYTTWAIGQHTREACAQLQILARAPGAVTAYDRSVRTAYERLYLLRCG
jgi:hypothetical protein